MGIEGIYTDPALAVKKAYQAPATVVNHSNRYVWYKGNLLNSNQIMAITRAAEKIGRAEKSLEPQRPVGRGEQSAQCARPRG